MNGKNWDYIDHMIMTCRELEVCLADTQTVEQSVVDINMLYHLLQNDDGRYLEFKRKEE